MLELCQRGSRTRKWNERYLEGIPGRENTLRDYDEHYDNELQMRA